jgi:exodeoxyribonuclease V alpha subunit
MCSAQFACVTGPPGSGKTTTLGAALAALRAAGIDDSAIKLAAPTGKAARRMAQATGRDASTIHRLLGWSRQGWAYDYRSPLDASVVFIDEASMIDYEIAQALLEGSRRSRLVLIGDADQLPPVGLGRMFGDLIDSGAVPVARLKTNHRAAEGSWVIRNAPRVLDGGPLELDECAGFEFLEVDDAADVVDVVRTAVLLAPDPNAVVVLAPQYAGAAGCDALNNMLDAALNRERAGKLLARGDGKCAVRYGTRVIQTRNNYDLDVMNGEIGVVEAIGPDDPKVVVSFPELRRVVTYETRDEHDALQPAYALTVHKTQGSEFARVIVICHSTHTHMLSRSILYTAITRAKQHVTLVGDERGLARALKHNAALRQTSLVERIRSTLEPAEASV